MDESGERELRAANSATDLVPGFEQAHGRAGPCELDGGGEPVRAGADDDGVVHVAQISP